MNPVRTVALITGREVTDRLRNKMYVIGTLLILAVVVAGIVIPGLLGRGGTAAEVDDVRLGVVGAVPDSFDRVLATMPGWDFDLVDLADRESAARAVATGEVDAALLDGTELMAEGAPAFALQAALETALWQSESAAQLEAAGLSDEEVAAALAPRQQLTLVDPAGEPDVVGFEAWLVAFATTIVLFGAVTANASTLLTGTVEEKSSRVVEVLLGSVRPWHLLTAKIIALTTLALAQVALFVAAALASNALVGTFELPAATGATVAVALTMLVVGFVFYAALYTVAGSLASTTEDAQGSAGPLNFLLMGAYFVVVIAVLPNPDGLFAQVLTYLPPTAPLTVPARVAFGAIEGWEVALATAVTLAGVLLTVALAARLYASSLLAEGKLTWRKAWRLEPIR